MAKAARATPPGSGLPEEIVIWEILVRLPPKSLLRCRAVCHAWRGATSTRDFLQTHHGHQPSLPIVCSHAYEGVHLLRRFCTLDHRAADAQFQQVVRLNDILFLEASCDGLVILSIRHSQYGVSNPATHQFARLHEIDGFKILGMYHHGPTGEYRLLLYWFQLEASDNGYSEEYGVRDGSYVFALGSGQSPRHIGCPEAEQLMCHHSTSLLFRGGLHWHLSRHKRGNNKIMVFDTTAESFRQMPSPVDEGAALFEMDGMLSMYRFTHAATNIDIWVLRDYESQAWAFKCRVEMPGAEIKAQFEKLGEYQDAVVTTSCDGELFVLVTLGEWLLQIDIGSKLVASFHRKSLEPTQLQLKQTHKSLEPTQLQLKQTLVPHTFFPAIEGYVVKAS